MAMTPRSTWAAGALACLAAVTMAACGSDDESSDSTATGEGAAAEVSGKVYYINPGSQAVRYIRFDGPNMEAAFKKRAPGIDFQILDGGNDAAKQLAQAETAIANNAKAIILSSADATQAAGILAKASVAKIPVISYAPESLGGPLYAHVSVPFSQIGDSQGKYLADNLPETEGPVRLAKIYGDPGFEFYKQLEKGFDEHVDPLIQSGKVEVVCEADSRAWSPTNSQRAMEQCLTKTNNGVDAVLGMNDDTLGGALAALRPEGLDSKVILFGGYDATIDAVRRVVTGQQAATMTPPYKDMADTAAQLAIAAIQGKQPPANLVNGEFDNKSENKIPAAFIPNVFITPDSIQKTVVDAGIYSKQNICQGVAADAEFCTA